MNLYNLVFRMVFLIHMYPILVRYINEMATEGAGWRWGPYGAPDIRRYSTQICDFSQARCAPNSQLIISPQIHERRVPEGLAAPRSVPCLFGTPNDQTQKNRQRGGAMAFSGRRSIE